MTAGEEERANASLNALKAETDRAMRLAEKVGNRKPILKENFLSRISSLITQAQSGQEKDGIQPYPQWLQDNKLWIEKCVNSEVLNSEQKAKLKESLSPKDAQSQIKHYSDGAVGAAFNQLNQIHHQQSQIYNSLVQFQRQMSQVNSSQMNLLQHQFAEHLKQFQSNQQRMLQLVHYVYPQLKNADPVNQQKLGETYNHFLSIYQQGNQVLDRLNENVINLQAQRQQQAEQRFSEQVKNAKSLQELSNILVRAPFEMKGSDGSVLDKVRMRNMIQQQLKNPNDLAKFVNDLRSQHPRAQKVFQAGHLTRNFGIREKFIELAQKQNNANLQNNSTFKQQPFTQGQPSPQSNSTFTERKTSPQYPAESRPFTQPTTRQPQRQESRQRPNPTSKTASATVKQNDVVSELCHIGEQYKKIRSVDLTNQDKPGSWMMNMAKDTGGFFSGKREIRQEQIARIESTMKKIANGNTSPDVKTEAARTVLQEMVKEIKSENNSVKSSFLTLCEENLNKLPKNDEKIRTKAQDYLEEVSPSQKDTKYKSGGASR